METFVVPTSTVEHLTKGIQSETKKITVILPDLSRDGKRFFPDGEVYIKISLAKKLKNKRVIVLHSGAPNPNEGLIDLELVLQILRDNNMKPEVFFTYFPYGMQDRVFEKGETNVAENLIEKLVNYYKVKKIYIIDPHFEGRKWIKKYPIESISAIPILMERVKEDFGRDILFLATDEGGKRRFKTNGFNKVRKNSYKVELFLPERLKKMIKGKIIGIVDDILKTGTTLLKVHDECKKYGAKKIICLVTHGVLDKGIEKVSKKFDKTYLTNSIKQRRTQIDITELILNAIEK